MARSSCPRWLRASPGRATTWSASARAISPSGPMRCRENWPRRRRRGEPAENEGGAHGNVNCSLTRCDLFSYVFKDGEEDAVHSIALMVRSLRGWFLRKLLHVLSPDEVLLLLEAAPEHQSTKRHSACSTA